MTKQTDREFASLVSCFFAGMAAGSVAALILLPLHGETPPQGTPSVAAIPRRRDGGEGSR